MGIIDSVIERIMQKYDVSQEQVDKAKALLDMIDIRETEQGVLVHVKMKDFQIIIDK